MTGKVLILGGYGVFGSLISRALAESGAAVIIAGRDATKAEAFAAALPAGNVETAVFDAYQDFPETLAVLRPAVVVNAIGPFHEPEYAIAKACIHAGAHYVDIADGREFVRNFITLNDYAKEKNIAVITGASAVPALTTAVIEHYLPEFSRLESVEAGISSGTKTSRGINTLRSLLYTVGEESRPFPTGEKQRKLFGWQNIHRVFYPELGGRLMSHVDVPDFDIIPARYGVKEMRFSAGIESLILHVGLWFMSWGVRFGLPMQLERDAGEMLKISDFFKRFGTARGGMHVFLKGADKNGKPLIRRFFLVSRNGDNPWIGAAAAIATVRKILLGRDIKSGAYACVGVVTLEECLAELEGRFVERL